MAAATTAATVQRLRTAVALWQQPLLRVDVQIRSLLLLVLLRLPLLMVLLMAKTTITNYCLAAWTDPDWSYRSAQTIGWVVVVVMMIPIRTAAQPRRRNWGILVDVGICGDFRDCCS